MRAHGAYGAHRAPPRLAPLSRAHTSHPSYASICTSGSIGTGASAGAGAGAATSTSATSGLHRSSHRRLALSSSLSRAQIEQELGTLDALGLLDEDELPTAVAPVQVGGSIDEKRDAAARLVQKYGGGDAKRSLRIERVLLSIADDEALTTAHVRPVQQMLDLLYEHFDRSTPEKGCNLAIAAGRNGARLSHSHSTQFAYVEQSLMLWREILSHLSTMWSLAEADLLDGNGYRLRDTGQGVHRVQSAPHVGRFMQSMLGRMQSQVRGGWVGSSAVHLGDNDVPNALVWIDKYTQIPRILAPISQALEGLDDVTASTPGVREYVALLPRLPLSMLAPKC